MTLFRYNNQQWFNTDCIETIDDYGDDIGVTLKSGRQCTIDYKDRELFLQAVVIPQLPELPESMRGRLGVGNG